MVERTHYQVLNVNPNDDYQTIKEAYHREARQSHPDKRQQQTCSSHFLAIQAAWECLSHDSRRKEYDLQLQQQEQTSKALPIEKYETELCQDEETGETLTVWTWPCRCGATLEYVEQDEQEVVECPNCSLLYRTNELSTKTENEN